MLLAGELAFIRAEQASALPDTCTVRTVTYVSDGAGGWTEGTSDTEDVPCRLMGDSAPGADEGLTAEQLRAKRVYTLTLAHDATLDTTSRIIKDGVTYEVLSVIENVSWHGSTRAKVQQVEA